MTSEIKDLSDQILNEIKQAKNILLHCHVYPDPDSVCSVLAMAGILKQMGKNVTPIMGDSECPEYLENVPHKDWLVKKNYTEINPEDYDLFIILDSASIDRISNLTDIKFPTTMRTVVIDHHQTNRMFGDINLVDKSRASTCENLFRLFQNWRVKIDQDTALLLFLGTYSDTGGFKYPYTSPETFEVATKLVKISPQYHTILADIENHRKPIDLEMMGVALSNIEKYCNERIALSVIPYEIIKQKGLSREEASEGLVPDVLRTVTEWKIVASIVEMSPDEVQVSLRTRYENDYDVSEIAKTVGDKGGGHRGAAGTTIHEPLVKAKRELLKTICEIYPEFK